MARKHSCLAAPHFLVPWLCLLGGSEARADDCTWAVGSGEWTTSGNWSNCGGAFPDDATDTATIGIGTVTLSSALTVGGVTVNGGTVNLNAALSTSLMTFQGGSLNLGQSQSWQNLTQTGGTLDGPGNLTISGVCNWNGGTQDGSGTTTASGGMQLGGGDKFLGRELANPVLQTATWTGGRFIYSEGGVLSNDGVFEARADTAMQLASGVAPRFDNNPGAIFRKLDSPGATEFIAIDFNNQGMVEVLSGTLDLSGGGSSTGSFSCPGGAVLEFGGGVHALTASASLNCPQTVFSGGTTTVAGSYTSVQSTTVSGGTVTWTGSTISVTGALIVTSGTASFDNAAVTVTPASLQISGGQLEGASHLVVSGVLTWTAGRLEGTGSITVNGGMTLAGGDKFIGRTLTNPASQTAAWTAGRFVYSEGGIFANNGLFLASANSTHQLAGGLLPRFDNNSGATFRKLASSGVTDFVSVDFNNHGRVEVQTGTLGLSGGGNSTGSFVCSDGTTLEFGGGTQALAAGASLNCPQTLFSGGTTAIAGSYTSVQSTTVSGGTVTWTGSTISVTGALIVTSGTASFDNATVTITPASLQLDSGILDGASNIVVSGTLSWTGGRMDGSGSTTVGGGMSLAGGDKFIGRTLTNPASRTAAWTSGRFVYSEGGIFNNEGLFEARTDMSQQLSAGLVHRFDNRVTGTFRKLASPGTTVFNSIEFTNSGSVEVLSGVLEFTAESLVQQRGRTVLLGGDLKSNIGNSAILIDGGLLAGTGTVDGPVSSSGTVSPGGTSTGSLVIKGDLTLTPGGILNFDLAGRVQGTSHDFVDVQSPVPSNPFAVDLRSQLTVTLADGFAQAVNAADTFTLLRSDGPLTGSFFNVSSGGRLTTLDGAGSFLVSYGAGSPFGEGRLVLSDFQPDPPGPPPVPLPPCALTAGPEVSADEDSVVVCLTTDSPGIATLKLTSDPQVPPVQDAASQQHCLQIDGLVPEQEYSFRVDFGCSGSGSGRVQGQFTTAESSAPVLEELHVPYLSIEPGMAAPFVRTNVASDTVADFGPTAAYGSTATIAELLHERSVPLLGLPPSGTAHFRVTATDAFGRSVQSPDHTFVAAPFGGSSNPLLLEGPSVDSSQVTDRSALVTWTTDEPTDSTLHYGFTAAALDRTVHSEHVQLEHRLVLSSLARATTYFYRVESSDGGGRTVSSAVHSFTTDAEADTLPPVVVDGPRVLYLSESPVLGFECDEPCSGELLLEPQSAPRGRRRVRIILGAHKSSVQARAFGLQPDTGYDLSLNVGDLSGNARKLTPSPPVSFVPVKDTTPPTLTAASVVYSSDQELIARWSTDEGSDSRVQLLADGLDTGYHLLDPAVTLTHQVRLTRLQAFAGKALELRLQSCNPDDLCSPILGLAAALASVDSTAPTFDGEVKIELLGPDSAVVAWTTSEPATSELSLSFNSRASPPAVTKIDPRLTNEHRVVLARLQPARCYDLTVSSSDPAGNRALAATVPQLCTRSSTAGPRNALATELVLWFLALCGALVFSVRRNPQGAS